MVGASLTVYLRCRTAGAAGRRRRQAAGAPGSLLRFSEQADDAAGLDVDVDVDGSRPLGQARHGAHLAEQRVQVPGAGGRPDVADRHAVAARPALERRVVTERQVRLGHAQRQLVQALLRELLDLGLGLGQVVHAVGAVDLGGDGLDLLLDGGLERIEELEVAALVSGRLDDLGRLLATVAAQRVDVDRHGVLGAGRDGVLAHDLDLAFAVEGEAVDRDHHGDAEELHVLDLLGEVLATPVSYTHLTL